MQKLKKYKWSFMLLKIGVYMGTIFMILGISGDKLVLAGNVKLNKTSATLFQGESIQLRLIGTKKDILWTTANKAIAVVTKAGKVTGKSTGVVNVTAMAGTKKYICKVSVKKKLPPIKSLEFQTDEVILYPGDEFQLQLKVQPSGGDRKGLVYLSNNKEVAGVTAKGKVVAHGIGDAIIYAQSKSGKKCFVKVKVLSIPELKVKGKSIFLGDTEDKVMKTFGYPDRGDLSVYGGKVYIYNNIRSDLLMIFINDGKVSGYFTNSAVFSSVGITPDTAMEAIPYYFEQDKESEWIRTYNAEGKYKAHILMDTIGTKTIAGIYVLEDDMVIKNNGEAMRGQELEFYDVAYSIRIKLRNTMLNWSEAASSSAKMHGMDMIIKNYVSNANFEGKSNADRLRELGIQSSLSAENILISNEDAIFAVYETLNTYEHRLNLVNPAWTNLGIGVSMNQEGKFYYVQEYFKE